MWARLRMGQRGGLSHMPKDIVLCHPDERDLHDGPKMGRNIRRSQGFGVKATGTKHRATDRHEIATRARLDLEHGRSGRHGSHLHRSTARRGAADPICSLCHQFEQNYGSFRKSWSQIETVPEAFRFPRVVQLRRERIKRKPHQNSNLTAKKQVGQAAERLPKVFFHRRKFSLIV